MTADLFNDIAPAEALGICVSSYSGGSLELSAPLEPNLNDKGTAFAGSIASLLALAGWGVITLQLKDTGITAHVMVVKNETEYHSAVRADMTCRAILPAMEAQTLVNDLKSRGRGRIQIKATVLSDGVICATSTADYAVILR